jgi:hypothetical protein
MARWIVEADPYKCKQYTYYFKHDSHEGVTIKVGIYCVSFIVTTDDDSPPQFVFQSCPEGNEKKFIQLHGYKVNNILDAELKEWAYSDIITLHFNKEMSKEEQQQLEELIDEEGISGVLTEDKGWRRNGSALWLSCPFRLFKEKDKFGQIVFADEDGHMVIEEYLSN